MVELTTEKSLENILGRVVEFAEITYKNKKGFLPIYFNYEGKNSVDSLFKEDKVTCAENFLKYLIRKQDKGDTNGIDI